MSGRVPARVPAADRAVAAAWERFASGEDVDRGVRRAILDSWRRCRDDFGVDPARDRAPRVEASPEVAPEESVLAAELGVAAGRIVTDVEALGGVLAIADGRGRMLATWGAGQSATRGARQNLGPLFSWSEPSTGTTAVGTALAGGSAVAVERFEHWCSAFHDWSCAAVAVADPVSAAPAGAIGVALWNRPLPPAVLRWLGRAAAGVERRLARRAVVQSAAGRAGRPGPRRVVALRRGRLVLVAPEHVRLAEIREGLVWLHTDEGPLRAAARGLDELERRLAVEGFQRVSRGTLVNLHRVREIVPAFKGAVWLVVDGVDVPVAVARRRVPALRAALGI